MLLPRPAVLFLLLLTSCVVEAGTSTPAAPPPSTPTAVTIPAPTVIDGYQPSVRSDNTRPLSQEARVPFATYLNRIHNRLHPVFADEFLKSLDALSQSHVLNQDLRADVELVIDQKTGQVVKLGIVRSSGVAAFDQAVLATVKRTQPFGPAPEIIASPDGNVYLHWEFHRDPYDACTTRNARPYILKSAP